MGILLLIKAHKNDTLEPIAAAFIGVRDRMRPYVECQGSFGTHNYAGGENCPLATSQGTEALSLLLRARSPLKPESNSNLGQPMPTGPVALVIDQVRE
jgi:hypothetical protein